MAASQQCTSHYGNHGDNEHVETQHASPSNELYSMDSVVESNSPHKLSHSQIEKVLLECPSSSLNVQEKEGLGLVAPAENSAQANKAN